MWFIIIYLTSEGLIPLSLFEVCCVFIKT